MTHMFVRFVQLTIVAIPVALFAWLLNRELVPTGTFVVAHAVGDASPFVDGLLPDARVDGGNVIVDDPVFFFAHPHRHFDTVDAEVWFKNDAAPILELGGLGNAEAQAYDLKPLQNLLIDDSSWTRLDENGTVLLQRTPTYASVADFLAHPPPVSTVATYQAALPTPFVLAGYAPSAQTRAIDVSLRGYHEFKTYVKDETLRFDFAYMDMNRDDGADPVSLVVTDANGQPVGDARASDDGDLSDAARPSGLRHVALSVPNLPEGVYKVQMQSDRDIFWRTITTTQQKAVFLNNLFLGDEVGYKSVSGPVTFWTEAKHLMFATRHVEGLQGIVAGASSSRLVIDEPYKSFALDVVGDGVQPVSTERGDLEVTADGHVAFSADMYFNPDPVRLTAQADLDRLGVDYVYATYVSPETRGDWKVARVTFDASRLVLDQGSWKFAFSAPGIKALGARVTVGQINMAWHRKPFTLTDLYDYVAGTHR